MSTTPHQQQQDATIVTSPLPVQPPLTIDQEIEEYEQKIRILRHDNSLQSQKIERLEGNLSTLYEGAEMEEENFTNIVLRRLRDIRGDKERLNSHLRLQEGRRAKEEAKLAAIQSQRLTLSKSLKAEEVNIQSRLLHQIELVKQQRQKLENKVNSEVLSSEDLQRELYQFRALLDAKNHHNIINLDVGGGGGGGAFTAATTDDEGDMCGGGDVNSASMSMLQASSISSAPTTPFGGGDATMGNLLQAEITRVRALQRETQERTVRAQRKREELEEQLFNFMARRGGGRAVAASSTPFLLSHPHQQHTDPFATPGRNEAYAFGGGGSTSRGGGGFSIGALDTGSYAQGGGGGNSSNASVVATPRSGTAGGGYVSRSQSLWSTTHSQAATGGGGGGGGGGPSSYRHYSACNTPIQVQQLGYSHNNNLSNPNIGGGGGGGSLAPSANSSFHGVRAMRSSSQVGVGVGGGGGGCDAVLNLLRLSQQHQQQQGIGGGGGAFGSSLPKDLSLAASPGSISQHLNPLNPPNYGGGPGYSGGGGSPSAVPRLSSSHGGGGGGCGSGNDLTGRLRSDNESATSSVHRYNPNHSSSSQIPSEAPAVLSPHRNPAVPVKQYGGCGGGSTADRRSHSQSRGVSDSASNLAPTNTGGPHTTTTTTSTRQTPLRTSEPMRIHTPAPLHHIMGGASTSSSSQPQQHLPQPSTHNSFSVSLANSAIPLQSTPRGGTTTSSNAIAPSVTSSVPPPISPSATNNNNSSTVASLRNSVHSLGGGGCDTGRSSVTGLSSVATGGGRGGGRHSPSVGGSFYNSNSAVGLYPPHLGGNGGGGGSNSYFGNTFGGSPPASVTTRRSSCSAVVRPATHLLSEFKEQQERLHLDFGRPSISSARALSVGSDLGGLGGHGGGGTDGGGSASSVSSPLCRDAVPTGSINNLGGGGGDAERVASADLANTVDAQRGTDNSTPISPIASSTSHNLFHQHSSSSRRFSGDGTPTTTNTAMGTAMDDGAALANAAASSVSVGVEESILSMGATPH